MLSQETRTIIKATAPVLAQHGTTITTEFYRSLFEAHPELLNVFNHANQAKGRQQTALANTVYAAAVHIDNLEAILPSVMQIAQKHVSLGIVPEQYPIVGEFLLKAIKTVLGDAATPEIINAWAEAYGVIADVFISVEKGMYDQAAEQTGGWRLFKEFTVVEKVQESELITSFYLKPTDGAAVPSYQPGQYISVRVKIPGEQYLMIRQYSLSKAADTETFRISVKRETDQDPNGKVSVYLHEQLEVGGLVEVTPPAGEFVLDESRQTPVVFLAGGVGITPLMSMTERLLQTSANRPIHFYHAARSEKDAAFADALTKLDAEQEHLSYISFFSETDGQFITREVLANVPQNADIYVCGPVGFMESMIANLIDLGFSQEQIHYEFFGPSMALKALATV
ncbi:NO-inducible flavohemoprotein [Chryseomicrobium excrementi]|uniref:Flavohemoprotein n=1 Tax=Chryseomicrobium excrementi TaxID=2041346 RepID=A0A2M9EYM6_9BACL|nr:NO-inducible flavohemoprotein [Chryseomicrobium excrementi]PJK16322.1 NO-inducible flavohemoprotein [Chryseomicrobium excrementi]